VTEAELFAKYDVPVPRYTSYPTVPQWHAAPSADEWIESLSRALQGDGASLSLYLHLPFCESLCTFCGCNTVITRDHSREGPYVDLLLAELDIYLGRLPQLSNTSVRQLHLGGGTPTFLSPASLDRLIAGVMARLPNRAAGFEGSVEVDPRVTTRAHLEGLAARGVRRLSLGVQDIDPNVQQLVNRMQPMAMTTTLMTAARKLGYESINVDLIYGLPGQTPDSMTRLATEIVAAAPDRLAVYSFARVPWIKPAQRKFRDDQVPAGAAKRELYEIVRTRLLHAGYVEIGLDHFARPDDSLARAAAAGALHRNFMGYADVHTTAMLGLGVSAISDTPDCYHQNEKILPSYVKRVEAGEVPTHRGHVLSAEDQRRRQRITTLMTTFQAPLETTEMDAAARVLKPLIDDGLVAIDGHALVIPPAGRPFLRNAATFFDQYFQHTEPSRPVYSTSA